MMVSIFRPMIPPLPTTKRCGDECRSPRGRRLARPPLPAGSIERSEEGDRSPDGSCGPQGHRSANPFSPMSLR